jgi:hypothetical protein
MKTLRRIQRAKNTWDLFWLSLEAYDTFTDHSLIRALAKRKDKLNQEAQILKIRSERRG